MANDKRMIQSVGRYVLRVRRCLKTRRASQRGKFCWALAGNCQSDFAHLDAWSLPSSSSSTIGLWSILFHLSYFWLIWQANIPPIIHHNQTEIAIKIVFEIVGMSSIQSKRPVDDDDDDTRWISQPFSLIDPSLKYKKKPIRIFRCWHCAWHHFIRKKHLQSYGIPNGINAYKNWDR